jgi:hypothetical protein
MSLRNHWMRRALQTRFEIASGTRIHFKIKDGSVLNIGHDPGSTENHITVLVSTAVPRNSVVICRTPEDVRKLFGK